MLHCELHLARHCWRVTRGLVVAVSAKNVSMRGIYRQSAVLHGQEAQARANGGHSDALLYIGVYIVHHHGTQRASARVQGGVTQTC